jgi:hypothetical protein
MVVIGLGQAGQNICKSIENMSKIRTIVLDIGNGITKQTSHEEYEKNVPRLGRKLKLKAEQDIWFVVCGGGMVSASTLAILEQIKDRNVRVALISPDPFLLSKTQTKQSRVVWNVLQEYARSGLIDSVYLFSNRHMASFVGQGSIGDLYTNINNGIANFIVTNDWFEKTPTVIGGLFEPKVNSTIRTISIGKIDDSQESFYFPLDNITESSYYYSISQEIIENEKNLLPKIKQRVILEREKGLNSSFGLWQNASDYSYFYSIKYTHFIQQEEK